MKLSGRRVAWMALILLVVLLTGGAIIYFQLVREEPLDTRFNGAYLLDDGRLVFIAAREADTLRYRMMSGESRALWPAGGGRFTAGPGWSGREPIEVTITFDGSDSGPPDGLDWKTPTDEQRALRLELPEVTASFGSADLELRAKLVLPKGAGPFPAVVFVHGSGRESAVDSYFNPYLFAAHGIAGLVYDKRGTGGSDGSYSQNFHLLSDDTAAAVEWLRSRPEIDPENIHLAGYSQGGWIAPLAATKAKVRSLLIAYGPMVPVTGEDRWGYVYALEQAGFAAETVHEVDEISAIAGDIIDHGENRWGELREALEEAEGRDWYKTVRGSDSLIGFLSSTRMPWWAIRLYARWSLSGDPPFIDRLYDPVPTVASLSIPSLWIFGGEDSSMPTDWSIEELERLQTVGRPVEIEVFPEAEHGILLFEDREGERSRTGYAPGYLPLQVEWIRRGAGLGLAPDGS
jgi:pimeloyl-ACP methyl ester carboxylesterase